MKVATRILALAAAVLIGGTAQGAGYPDHPVKIVVPFAPAGPTDVMARLIAQKLSESLKQQFYVENHPGAGGNIGMTQVAKSAPDGYTMLVASSSYVVNPSLYAKNPYDPFKDFAPVTLAAASPNILVVNADFPAKSVKELIEPIKKEPGKYNYAMTGTGTPPHLAGELFKLTFKLDLATVPFNGAGPAIQSAVADHTPIALHHACPRLRRKCRAAIAMDWPSPPRRDRPPCPTCRPWLKPASRVRNQRPCGVFSAGWDAEGDYRSAQSRDRQGDGHA